MLFINKNLKKSDCRALRIKKRRRRKDRGCLSGIGRQTEVIVHSVPQHSKLNDSQRI